MNPEKPRGCFSTPESSEQGEKRVTALVCDRCGYQELNPAYEGHPCLQETPHPAPSPICEGTLRLVEVCPTLDFMALRQRVEQLEGERDAFKAGKVEWASACASWIERAEKAEAALERVRQVRDELRERAGKRYGTDPYTDAADLIEARILNTPRKDDQ